METCGGVGCRAFTGQWRKPSKRSWSCPPKAWSSGLQKMARQLCRDPRLFSTYISLVYSQKAEVWRSKTQKHTSLSSPLWGNGRKEPSQSQSPILRLIVVFACHFHPALEASETDKTLVNIKSFEAGLEFESEPTTVKVFIYIFNRTRTRYIFVDSPAISYIYIPIYFDFFLPSTLVNLASAPSFGAAGLSQEEGNRTIWLETRWPRPHCIVPGGWNLCGAIPAQLSIQKVWLSWDGNP